MILTSETTAPPVSKQNACEHGSPYRTRLTAATSLAALLLSGACSAGHHANPKPTTNPTEGVTASCDQLDVTLVNGQPRTIAVRMAAYTLIGATFANVTYNFDLRLPNVKIDNPNEPVVHTYPEGTDAANVSAFLDFTTKAGETYGSPNICRATVKLSN